MKVKNIIRDNTGRFLRTWDKHRIKRECLLCGKEFETVESRIKAGKGKYCSRECYNKLGRSKGDTYKLKQQKAKKGKRVSPDTEFRKGEMPWNKGIKHEKICGKNHWNWKNGKTKETQRIYHSLEYKQWRTAVFERDSFTCQVCKQVGGTLEAHHIKERCNYPELVFEQDNGVTLCKDCHNLTKLGGSTKCVV